MDWGSPGLLAAQSPSVGNGPDLGVGVLLGSRSAGRAGRVGFNQGLDAAQ